MPPIIPDPTDIPDEGNENTCSTTAENIVFPHSDSDSESENVDHDGYELLSQDPEFFFHTEDDDEDCIAASDVEESSMTEVSNLNSNSQHLSDSACENIECSSEVKTMSEAHIETIKSVMKGITLPSSSLPQWASLVPEEEWKAALFSQMHARNSKINFNDTKMHPQPPINESALDVSNEALR